MSLRTLMDTKDDEAYEDDFHGGAGGDAEDAVADPELAYVGATDTAADVAAADPTQPPVLQSLQAVWESTPKRKVPFVKFSQVSTDDYFKVLRYRAAIAKSAAASGAAGGAGAATAIGSAIGSTPRAGAKSSRHVKGCTCPTCRKALRQSENAPIKMYYKMHHSGVNLIHTVFRCHGFKPTNRNNWNLMWTSAHLKSYMYSGLGRHQKINQFPRSYLVTRKDAMAKNISRMQELHGETSFGFIPKSFVLPGEAESVKLEWARNPDQAWIVKPSASSQGKGIYITQNLGDILSAHDDEGCTVSHYVNNPLLINGVKFDLRVYVAVTSFSPLRIYVHEEGLGRFATVPYDPHPSHFSNQFMHLTNYSINKFSADFVPNTDPNVDNEGHKWSLTAVRRHLRAAGIDDDAVWQQIYDLVIKCLLSAEPQITAAMDMFVPHPQNCYQLFGFDVLLDDELRPWLLEVNFAPSLNCESPLDHRIKAEVIADLHNLAGCLLYDPEHGAREAQRKAQGVGGSTKAGGKSKPATTSTARPADMEERLPPIGRAAGGAVVGGMPGSKTERQAHRPGSGNEGAGRVTRVSDTLDPTNTSRPWSAVLMDELSVEERRALRETEEEHDRRGRFRRVFPTPSSYVYKPFLCPERPLSGVLVDYYFRLGSSQAAASSAAMSRDQVKAEQRRAVQRARSARRRATTKP